MKNFAEQLSFFTGRKDHQSAIAEVSPFNMGQVLCQMNLLEQGMIGNYHQVVAKMQTFLAIPEVFCLLLLSVMTSISPELQDYNTFLRNLLSRLANQTLAFEEPFAKNQEVLMDLTDAFEDLKKTMAIWKQHSLKAMKSQKA